jgi:hypothetical protein
VIGVALAIVWALRGRRLPAICAGLFACAFISRDFEIAAVVATLAVADAAGAAFARHREQAGVANQPLGLPQLLLAASFLFGLAFVQRVGIQGSLDIGAMDWGVAGFGDPHVPAWVVGGALGLKYVLALLLAVGAFLAELPHGAKIQLLRAVYVTFLARAVVLSAMFLVAGASYWTGLRVLGDLPFSWLWSTSIALAWLALARRPATS